MRAPVLPPHLPPADLTQALPNATTVFYLLSVNNACLSDGTRDNGKTVWWQRCYQSADQQLTYNRTTRQLRTAAGCLSASGGYGSPLVTEACNASAVLQRFAYGPATKWLYAGDVDGWCVYDSSGTVGSTPLVYPCGWGGEMRPVLANNTAALPPGALVPTPQRGASRVDGV
jgi:hypothetical protein